MKKVEQRQYFWLQFQKTNNSFTVSRTEAYGRGATGMPIPRMTVEGLAVLGIQQAA